jgi:hypothetical protein
VQRPASEAIGAGRVGVPSTSAIGPFDLDTDDDYRAWRDAKLADYPASLEELTVAIRDPRDLRSGERDELLDRVRRASMVVYASPIVAADKDIPRLLGRQVGLDRLDRNWLADDDGISQVKVAAVGTRGEFIPYTNHPIRWHTDGYYNPPERRIRAMVLHCVSNAASGGETTLLDHELAYLMLRDANPEFVRALMQPDAMTIPARTDDEGVARTAQSGPVFHVDPEDGGLHMRYTARTKSIEWKQEPMVLAAAAYLTQLLAGSSPYIHRLTLQPGMGLLCNNVLHARSGFTDDPVRPRLLYRGRYYDRIAAT